MFRRLLPIAFLLFISSAVLWGQQEEHYTQWMYYKMGLNPAYAGSTDAACITALARSQWVGIDGAPQTQLLTFNMPLLNQRIGVGGTVMRQTIGITEKYTAEAVYSYRIRWGRGTLAMGVQGSVRLLRSDFSQVEAIQPKDLDQAIPVGIQSKFVPNFGAGLYYKSNSFYVGFSVPRILQTNIDLADTELTISREVLHMYLMGGITFELSETVDLQPQVLLKYVDGAPFDGDVNANLIFNDKFTTGISYRLGGSQRSGIGESISLLLAIQLTDDILFGASYDATLSELRNYNNGTFEAVFNYCIGGRSEGDEFISPRFF
jgi:type IX secretion system PorP/SprF family membrane protein